MYLLTNRTYSRLLVLSVWFKRTLAMYTAHAHCVSKKRGVELLAITLSTVNWL